jgi:hypothetical protein
MFPAGVRKFLHDSPFTHAAISTDFAKVRNAMQMRKTPCIA